jgi:pimeloyl-ACP methyl ester carboxylesterase
MRSLLSLLGAAFSVALLFVAALYLLQERLIYLPAKASLASMTSAGLRAWPTDKDFRALLAEPAGPARGTVIVFHGNAGHAGHRGFYADALLPLGWRVLLAEYPGYGARGGALGEASLVADAQALVTLASQHFGAPLIVLGESLGAGVAAAAARQRAPIDALLLITPWDRLASVGSYHYPWLPVRWLLRDRYDNAANLANWNGPTLIVLAERDSIVPAPLGRALHDALRRPKRLVVMRAADHNDWPERVDADWWRAVMDFAAQGR